MFAQIKYRGCEAISPRRRGGSHTKAIFFRQNIPQQVHFHIVKNFFTNPLTNTQKSGIMLVPLRAEFFVVPFAPSGRSATEGGTKACKGQINILMGGAAKMANDARVKITLVCTECKQRNYDTKKNKKNDPDRIELNKFCRFCRKHTLHKESK